MTAARSAVTERVQAKAALAFVRSHSFSREAASVILVRNWNPRATVVLRALPKAKGTSGSLTQRSKSTLGLETDSASSGKSSRHQITPES